MGNIKLAHTVCSFNAQAQSKHFNLTSGELTLKFNSPSSKRASVEGGKVATKMVPEDDADRRRQRYRRAVEILRDPRLVKDDTYAEKLATETAQERRANTLIDDGPY